MAAKKPEVFQNEAGEHLRRMPDGTVHISRDPDHSPVLRKLREATPANKEAHAALADEKHLRVSRKKARQAANGWPADKSPV